MAYDPASETVVLTAGLSASPGLCGVPGSAACADTWAWDGDHWKRHEAVSAMGVLPGRLAWDGHRGRLVQIGEPRRHALGIWVWEDRAWQRQATPEPRKWTAMSHDGRRGRVVLFGGWASYVGACGLANGFLCSDTWEWDGVDWRRRRPETSPSARYAHALAFDGSRGRTVLFGGCGGQNLPAHSPPARHSHALVADPLRGAVLLFGGRGADGEPLSDTWIWDGQDWAELRPRVAPPPRARHAMAQDVARGVTVVFGGRDADLTLGDTWEWDGAEWTQAYPLVAAPGRYQHALAYDPGSGGVLTFGGVGFGNASCWSDEGSEYCSQTWIHAPSRAYPRLIAAFDLRPLDPSAADRSTRSVLAVDLRTVAGGLGHTQGTGRADGDPVPGYRLSVSAFGHGGWLPLHQSPDATPDAPEDWTGTFDHTWGCGEPRCEAATIDRWRGADGLLHLDLAPLAPQGASADRARIALDYVELGIRYWRTGCEAPSELDPEGTPDGTPCSDGRPDTMGETCRAYDCVAP